MYILLNVESQRFMVLYDPFFFFLTNSFFSGVLLTQFIIIYLFIFSYSRNNYLSAFSNYFLIVLQAYIGPFCRTYPMKNNTSISLCVCTYYHYYMWGSTLRKKNEVEKKRNEGRTPQYSRQDPGSMGTGYLTPSGSQ